MHIKICFGLQRLYSLEHPGGVMSIRNTRTPIANLPEAMIGDPTDIEFVIRETRRKFQHTLSQVTVWERLAV